MTYLGKPANGGQLLSWTGTKFAWVSPAPYLPLLAGTSSTSLTEYQTIGGVYLDSAIYTAINSITLEVMLEATAGTAALQLYNVTDSVAEATLTSTSISPEMKLASISIPNSTKFYEVQLKRIGGTTLDLITCKMARLLIS